MATPIEIQVVQTGDGNALQKAGAQLDTLAQKSGTAAEKTRALGEIGNRALDALALGIRAASSSADGLDKNLQQLINTAGRTVSALAIGGPLAASAEVAGAGFGMLMDAMAKTDERAGASLDHFIGLRKELGALGQNKDIDQFAQRLQLSVSAVTNFGNATDYNLAQLQRLGDAQNTGTQLMERYRAAQTELTAAQAAQSQALKDPILTRTAGTMDAIADRVSRAKKEVSDLSWAINANDNSQASLTAEVRESVLAFMAQEDRVRKLTEANKTASASEDDFTRRQQMAADAVRANTAAIAAQQKAMDTLLAAEKAILKGAIAKVLVPTQVQEKDFLPGRKDAWDEFARRAEAVAKGTDASTYGDKFQAMLGGLKMNAQEAADAFRDFSLASDPKGLQIYKDSGAFDTIIENVNHQIDSMIGKQRLEAAAFDDVVKNLSADKQKALRDLGIESLGDAYKQSVGIKAAPDFASKLAEINSAITSAIPPNLETTVLVNYQIVSSGGGAAALEGATVSSGDLSSTSARDRRIGGLQEFAEGGYGTVTRSGVIYVDRGENYWFSGTHGQVPAPGGPQQVNITVNGAGMDIPTLARAIAREIQRNR